MSNPPTIDDFIPDEADLDKIELTGSSQAAPTDPPEEPTAETTEAETEATEAAAESGDTDDWNDDKARAAKLAHDLRQARREARQREAELQTLRGQRQAEPDEELDRRANARAEQLAAQRDYTVKVNSVVDAGRKKFGAAEFDSISNEIAETFGNGAATVVEIVYDLDNGAEVLAHLASNPDILDKLASMPPHRLGAALATESAKLSAPKTKPKSNAPKPISPVPTVGTVGSEREPTGEEWYKREQANFIKSMGYGS